MTIKAGILGASGYTGAELLRLLAVHPEIQVTLATADSQAGKLAAELYPNLSKYGALRFASHQSASKEIDACDVVFCALPHGEAMKVLPSLSAKLIVDLGGDFRLKDPQEYNVWYQREHTAPAALESFVYGLPELFREKVRASKRIANPGCYATAAILALAPLYREGVAEGVAVIDAVSGLSGAGRNPAPGLHLSHAYEDVRAYKIAAHQHTPEIEAALSAFSSKQVKISLTPHLVPMVRGIHATCSLQVSGGTTREKLMQILRETYAGEQFVLVRDDPPGTKEVRGSNMACLSVNYDKRTGRAIVTSVLDNLVKGAAGQAIQNANLSLGFEEALGLPQEGFYP